LCNIFRFYRRNFSLENKHPVLTPQAKAAGDKAAALRNTDSTLALNTTSLDTILSQAGLSSTDTSHSNAPITPPLHVSSTYSRPASGEYGPDGFIYTRTHNETRLLFEKTMAQLETMQKPETPLLHQPQSFAFSSGMAAVSAIIMATSSPLHVILPDDVYWGVPNMLLTVFNSREDYHSNDSGISHSTVDLTQIPHLEKTLMQILEKDQPFKSILVWIETPSNPRCKVIDIEKITQCIQKLEQSFSRKNIDVIVAVDSTMSPPNITQPLLVREISQIITDAIK
jgi:cystathionine beta-lyase/cystathionine gamma-synthase